MTNQRPGAATPPPPELHSCKVPPIQPGAVGLMFKVGSDIGSKKPEEEEDAETFSFRADG